MRSVLIAATIGMFVAIPGASHAQSPEEMMLRMETAMAEAQAQASRPGDEALSCEALEAEMIAVTEDPAFQARVAESGAWAEGRLDQANAMASRARAQMGVSMILGLASSFVPGAGVAGMIVQRAMAVGQQAQGEEHMTEVMQMAESMTPFMPQIMRGQRVYELAQAKQCAFVAGAEEVLTE